MRGACKASLIFLIAKQSIVMLGAAKHLNQALLEHVLCFLKQVAKDVLVVLFALFAFQAGKFLEQAFLFCRQAARGHNLDNDVFIAAGAAMYHGHTHALEAERSTALRTGGNLENRCLAIYGGHFNLVAEGSLRKADRQFIEDIVPLPFEELVRFYRQYDIQVPRRAAAGADFAFARDAHIYAIVYTGRDVHYDAAIIAHPTLAPALFTGSSDNTALAPATIAHRDVDELAKNGLLYASYLTRTLTYRAARGRGSWLRPTAATGSTGFPARKLYLFLATKDGFLKRDSQVVTKVGPALCARAPLCICARAGKERLEDIIDTAEPAEVVGASAAHAIIKAGMPKAVIGGPLLRVAQYFIGFIDFYKTSFRSLLFVGVRMVLFSKTTIRFFQLIVGCAL